MTDAPFALPLRMIDSGVTFQVYASDGQLIYYTAFRDRAEYLIRAVNGYAKMRDALEKISNNKQQAIPSALDGMAAQYSRIIRDFKSIARTILKEIDNG